LWNWSWVPQICTYPTRSQTSSQKGLSNCQDRLTKNSQQVFFHSLAWSIITRTIYHVIPTYSHHLPHLPRKVPDSSGQMIVNIALTNSNAFLHNKWSALIQTSLSHLKSTWTY
jgi:hypothetical protein